MSAILTPERAFEKLPNEVSIPIDLKMWDFQFTRHWFRNRNQCTWSEFLKPKFGDGKPINMLQVGVFEGMDAVWCCQNLLTHDDSRLVAVDPWAATSKLDQAYMDAVELRARHNLKPWSDKVTVWKNFSQTIMPNFREKSFDLIVIDGDHNKEPVIRDATEAIRVAKPGCVLVFDDVRNRVPKKDHVQAALDEILQSSLGKNLKLVWVHRFCNGYEVIKK